MIDYKAKINTTDYDFLRTDNRIQNLMILGLGGSHAYGTNTENSDLDVRGVALNSKREILLGTDFEQVVNETTDTTVYSLKKLIHLLTNCNPNTIEILGLKPEHYLYISKEGQELLDNKKMFLSQRAINSFGEYALSQLNRLVNKSGKSRNEITQNELRSMNKMLMKFGSRYQSYAETGSEVVIRPANTDGNSSETDRLYFNMNLKNLPMAVVIQLFNEIVAIDKDYRSSTRNEKAIAHNKLGKHMMHLVRLYYMVFDILEKEEINTYRENEHDLLMRIRNGEFLKDEEPTPEFHILLDELNKRFEYAKQNTSLPETPNIKLIEDFVVGVNQNVLVS